MSSVSSIKLDDNQVEEAIRVLRRVVEKQKEGKAEPLIETDNLIQLVIGFNWIGEKRRNTPINVVLKNSVFSVEDGDSALLIMKEPINPMKLFLEKNPVRGLEKVIGLEKIRTRMHTFKLQRDLGKSYTQFLCDERIIPMMPVVFGNKNLGKKKHPISVKLSCGVGSTCVQRLEKALASVPMCINWGTCTVVKAGKLSFTPEQIIENIHCILDVLLKRIPADSIKSLGIKTMDSTCIPFYENIVVKLSETDIDVNSGEKVISEEEEEEMIVSEEDKIVVKTTPKKVATPTKSMTKVLEKKEVTPKKVSSAKVRKMN